MRRQMLAAVSSQLGNTEVALSVLTLLELAHGAARANTLERKSMREQFIEELLTALPVHPVTAAVALRTDRLMKRIKPEECGFRLLIS